MYNGYICYVTDCETTNLDTVIGDVIEISMLRLTMDDSDVKPEQKTWLLKAMNPSGIQDSALAINGHKRDDILHLSKFGRDSYRLPAEVVAEIELWIMEDCLSSMDRIFVGQNPRFDIEALQNLWKKVDSLSSFPFDLEKGRRTIDTASVVTLFDLCIGKRRLYYNLGNLVKAFGVKKLKAHQAAADVMMTKDLLVKLMSPIKSLVKDNFSECYPNEE